MSILFFLKKVISKISKFLIRISRVCDNLCTHVYMLEQNAWLNYYNSRTRNFISGSIESIGIIFAIFSLAGCCIFLSFIFESKLLVASPLIIILGIGTGIVCIFLPTNLVPYMITLVDGYKSTSILSIHLKQRKLDIFKLEYDKELLHELKTEIKSDMEINVLVEIEFKENKKMFFENREKVAIKIAKTFIENEKNIKNNELISMNNYLIKHSNKKVLQYFKNRIEKPFELADKLKILCLLLADGKLSGFEQRANNLNLNAAPIVLQRTKIELPAMGTKLDIHKKDKLKEILPLLNAYFQFSQHKKIRINNDKPLFEIIYKNTFLLADICGTILSYVQSFDHPIINNNDLDKLQKNIKNEILTLRDKEISTLYTNVINNKRNLTKDNAQRKNNFKYKI